MLTRRTDDQFSPDKLLFHTDRLIPMLSGQIPTPAVYEVSPVGYCNQSCVYCVSKDLKSQKSLSEKQAECILNQIANCKGRAVTITGGGEPLLHPDITRIIEYASSVGLSIGLITNGTCIDNRVAEAICRHTSFCRISFDAISLDEYKRLRGTDHRDHVLENIKELIRVKSKFMSKTILGIQIVWCDQSFEEIESTVSYFSTTGIDFVQIRPVDNIPSRKDSPLFSVRPIKEVESFLLCLVRKYQQSGFMVIPSISKWNEVFENNVNKPYHGCPGGGFTCSIGHDSRVYFCCTHIGNPKFVIGDLTTELLEDVLDSGIRKNLIRSVDHKHCQNQCRNHNINNLIHSLQQTDSIMLDHTIQSIKNKTPPLHWEFL